MGAPVLAIISKRGRGGGPSPSAALASRLTVALASRFSCLGASVVIFSFGMALFPFESRLLVVSTRPRRCVIVFRYVSNIASLSVGRGELARGQEDGQAKLSHQS